MAHSSVKLIIMKFQRLRFVIAIIALLSQSLLFAETAKFKHIKAMAKQGDIDALIELANCYAYGEEDVKPNIKKAEKIFTEELDCSYRSHRAINLKALYYWGLFLFLRGDETSQWGKVDTYERALLNIKAAADEGYLLAQAIWARSLMGETKIINYLSLVYREDYLVELTKFIGGSYFPLAKEYYRKAAEQGDAQMQFEFAEQLCKRALSAQGTYQDEEDAWYWYRIAAEQNHIEAQFRLGYHLFFGTLFNKPDTVAAVNWLEKAALAGHDKAVAEVGFILINSKSQSDQERGEKYLRESSADNLRSCRYLAYGILNNQIKEEHEGELIELLSKGSDSDPVSAILLGHCYDKGIECEKDPVTAAKFYELGKEKGGFPAEYEHLYIPSVLEACKRLAYFYENGIGVYKNRDKAEKYNNYVEFYEEYINDHPEIFK